MQHSRGAAIPGLAMAASELPTIEGLIRLENPEIGSGEVLAAAYTLEDLAERHLARLRDITFAEPPTLIGISMGAMIVSVLATDLRSELPAKCRFRFIAPSANSADAPAASDELLEKWRHVRDGDVESFGHVLEPFFSDSFRTEHPDRFERYVHYRAFGENNQSMKAFRRQTAALRAFRGEKYYPRLDPAECEFIRGADDIVFGVAHMQSVAKLAPAVKWTQIRGAGHFLNFEHPEVFDPSVVLQES